MGGRDHSCKACGRGGFNDPDGECECSLPKHEPAKKNAGLADGYCRRCDMSIGPIGIEYLYGHPEHYDGVSEWQCPFCGRREGRWTGSVLTDGATEPRLGKEDNAKIIFEQLRFPIGSQPR